MSDCESHKGRIKLVFAPTVKDNELKTRFIEFLEEKHPDFKKEIEDMVEWNDESETIDSNNYIILSNKLYLIEDEYEDSEDYCYISEEQDGWLDYDTKFYNGATSLGGMLEDKLREKRY